MNYQAVFVAAGLLACCAVQAASESGVPNLLGTWTGTFTGGVRFGGGDLAPTDAKPTFVHEGMNRQYTLKIVEQNGRGIRGTWSSVKGSEDIQGVIRLDNQTVLFVDPDSYETARILSPGRTRILQSDHQPEGQVRFLLPPEAAAMSRRFRLVATITGVPAAVNRQSRSRASVPADTDRGRAVSDCLSSAGRR